MGYVKEPEGVVFLVEKQRMTSEIESLIANYISKSKIENKASLENLRLDF